MTKTKRLSAVVSIFLLLTWGCSSQPAINKTRFGKAKAAAQAVKAALASGASYQDSAERVEHLSAEISALKYEVTTKREKELLEAYSDLLGYYKDGLLLWKYKLEFASFDFMHKGRIYVSQDLEPVVWKYGLPTETHIYAPTHQRWNSVDEGSIKVIWANADSQLKIIENIENY